MAEIDPVILQLRVDAARYQKQLADTTRSVDRAFGRQEARVRQLESEMRRSSGAIGNTLKGLAVTLATAFSGRELVGLIDTYTRFQNQLRVAGLEGEQLAKVQERLRAVGARYGVEIESLGTSFSRVAQVQDELGASTEDLLRLNEIVAASLKVAGTDAQAASGALLQLSQALGSGVVRAEEFNSILEGALPLAQAAARGIEGIGGSVSKLRSEVAEGNITSREFFEGVLRGGVDTLEQAESATLTLQGAFTSLRNELTLYFGEAAEANGATAALAGAIKALADNLDLIIPALAIIATAMAGRYVAGALAAGTATRALSAHLSVATTSLAGTALAARSAGTALLAAFGGPVGLAITGVTLGLGYLATESAKAEAELDRLADQTTSLTGKADALEQQLREAGASTNTLEEASSLAKTEIRNLADDVDSLTRFLEALETQSYEAAGALAVVARSDLALRRNELRSQAASERNPLVTAGLVAIGVTPSAPGESNTERELAQVEAQLAQVDRIMVGIRTARQAGIEGPPTPRGATSASSAGASGSATRATQARERAEGERARIAERAASEEARLAQEELQARIAITDNADERYRLQQQLLGMERDERIRQIQNEEGYTQAQREAQIARINALYGEAGNGRSVTAGLYQRAAAIDADNELTRIEQDQLRLRADTLRDLADIEDNTAERNRLEREALAIEQDLQQSLLRQQIANGQIADADEAQALLASQQSAARERLRRQQLSPGQAYAENLAVDAENINDALERIQVDALDDLNDGLVAAIQGTKSLGDVFSDIADQIVADLLRIAIQQAIIQPLANSLFGGGKGGGLLGSLFGSLLGAPGKAGGGAVGAGRPYMVGESGRELFVPNVSGTIVPNSALGGSGVATVRLQLSGDLDARIEKVSGGVAVEVVRGAAPTLVDAAANETARRLSRPSL